MLRKVKTPRHRDTLSGQQAGRTPVLKELFLCVLSAVLLILSFPRFNLEFLAWFGFVPVFFALNNKSSKQSFFLFFITGIIFWSGIVYWLVHVTLPGAIVLILYLALYFAIFGLIIRPCTKHSTPYALIFIPSVWVLLEYIRGHLFTGFPWALLGYSQYLNLPVIQIADITGVWGVSFLVMMVNVLATEMISYRLPALPAGRQATGYRQNLKGFLLLACSLWLVACGYGYYKLYSRQSTVDSRQIKISVVQGNIPQELKWDRNEKDFIIDEYLGLTVTAIEDKPDLIIWPESALPVILEEEPSYFRKVIDFVNENNMPLLLGAVRSEGGLYYNSALLIPGESKSITKYNKLHLVPFGEYIPLRKALPFLETIVPIGDFTSGKEYTVFRLPTPNSQLPAGFSVLICFEDLFPELSREFKKRGADFLVNITNDAWFKKTSAPYQHLSASVFSGVENRVFLARAANTGISGFIAPSGKIISLVRDKKGKAIFVSGHDTQTISVSKVDFSFYSRFGDIFVIVCVLFALYGTMQLLRKRKA